MPSDDMTFIERMRGKRTHDINLPAAPGAKRDPRLDAYKPGSVRNALGKAVEGVKTLQDKGLIGKRSPGGKR
jgi:hypothetical protein